MALMGDPGTVRSRALRQLLALSLSVLWAWSATDALIHSVVVQHEYCAEHDAVEDHGPTDFSIDAPAHADGSGAERLAANQAQDGHDSCAHTATIREDGPALVPPSHTALAPPPLIDAGDPPAIILEADRPRGPPRYRIAPKTSPPHLA